MSELPLREIPVETESERSSVRPSRAQNELFRLPIGDGWLLHAPLHEVNALLTEDDLAGLGSEIGSDPELGLIRQHLLAEPKHRPAVPTGEIDPKFVALVTTRGCNISCVYCHFDGPTSPKNTVDLDRCMDAVDWVIRHTAERGRPELPIHFFGGEPLSAPKVLEALMDETDRRCRELGVSPLFIVTTNGVVTTRRAEWLAERFSCVVLSMDGPQEIHDRYRPIRGDVGSFERVAQTADILAEREVELYFRAAVTAESVGQMAETAEWMSRRWRPKSIKFEALTVNDLTVAAGIEPPDPFEFAINWAKAHQVAGQYGVRLSYAPINPGEPRLTSCLVGDDAIVVHPDGKIHACYLSPNDWEQHGMDLNLGEVSEDHQISIRQQSVDSVRELVTEKPRCENCFCQWSCSGGCHVTETYRGSSTDYNDFCIGTRIISAYLLLIGMGCEPMAKELLANRKALEQIAFQGSDVLSLGSLGERLSGNGGTE